MKEWEGTMNSKNLSVIAIVLGLIIVVSELALRKAQSQPRIDIPAAGKIEIPNAGVPQGAPTPAPSLTPPSLSEGETPEIKPNEIRPEAPDNRRILQRRPFQRQGCSPQPQYGSGGCPQYQYPQGCCPQ